LQVRFSGADIKVPNIYKFIIKYITPNNNHFLRFFLFKPLGNNWSENVSSFFSGNGWPLDNGSIIKMVTHAGIRDQIALATDPAIIEQLQDKICI
jgi:hypothetical protein